jgi:peptidoglycan hydrolase-like protein with peptidoglycan-binding domain
VKKLVIISLAAAALSAAAFTPANAQSLSSSVASLDMSAVPDLGRGDVRTVQRALRDKNEDPGPIDGVVGPRTRSAVRAFQKRYGMEPSGKVDNQLLFALGDANIAVSAAR